MTGLGVEPAADRAGRPFVRRLRAMFFGAHRVALGRQEAPLSFARVAGSARMCTFCGAVNSWTAVYCGNAACAKRLAWQDGRLLSNHASAPGHADERHRSRRGGEHSRTCCEAERTRKMARPKTPGERKFMDAWERLYTLLEEIDDLHQALVKACHKAERARREIEPAWNATVVLLPDAGDFKQARELAKEILPVKVRSELRENGWAHVTRDAS